jgi:hypothetical protein
MDGVKKIALILWEVILISGCSALNVAQINYDVVLSHVDRSPAASTAKVVEKPSRYADNLIEAGFVFTSTSIDINILNKTDLALKLVWDESAFVDRDGSSTKVTRQGLEAGNRTDTIPPSIIPPGGVLSHVAIPTNLVAWQGSSSAPYGNHPGSGKNYATMPYGKAYGGMASGPVTTTADEAQKDFTKEMQGSIGSKMGLVLSFLSANLKYEYTFWFEIRDATLVGK